MERSNASNAWLKAAILSVVVLLAAAAIYVRILADGRTAYSLDVQLVDDPPILTQVDGDYLAAECPGIVIKMVDAATGEFKSRAISRSTALAITECLNPVQDSGDGWYWWLDVDGRVIELSIGQVVAHG